MKKDPVCQMEVSPEHAVTAECDGETYYFCSEGCREKFFRDRSCRIPRSAYDLIIVGGGPAGLTAGTFAATMKINAFLIASDLGGQAIDSTAIENYMGFDFITGPDCATSHPGLFAAGDVTDAFGKRIVIAAGEGAKAAIAARQYLLDLRKKG